MAITYSSGAGTHFTSSASNSTVKSFTGGKVRLETTIVTTNNGNLMASPVYTGRLIIITGGTGVGQTRFISAQTTGTGDGNDVDITVSEAWATNPDGTSTYVITYITEDAATLGGLGFITRSGFWEWGREVVVESGAYFFVTGAPHEWNDEGSTSAGSWQIESGGRLDIGYSNGGVAVAGTVNIVINKSTGEWGLDIQTGATVNIYDMTLVGIVNNKISVTGGTITWQKGKMQTMSYQSLFAGSMSIKDWSFVGKGATTDWIRIEDTVLFDGVIMDGTNGLDSLDDALTETMTVRNTIFLNPVSRNVWVHDDKTWNFVNPVNLGANSTLIVFETDDLNEVNHLFSVDISVTEPDGTAIVDADCYIYEGLLNSDLPTANRVDTDASGLASTDVLYKKFTFPSSVFTTVTSGAWSLKVYEWLKAPFVTALVPNHATAEGLVVGVTLLDDPNIVQTTQATAITSGSGITVERPTNPTQLLSYDTGTILIAAGNTVTGGTSGATGIATEITEGDVTSGRVHLRARNATAFQLGEDLEVSAAKVAQATSPLVVLDYSTHIDADGKSLQAGYDYIAARQAEDTISADGVTFNEWGEGEHAQIMFAGGGDFFRTERNVGLTDGVFISDRGSGGVTYLTADDGTQYTPPVSVTISITVSDKLGVLEGAVVYIQLGTGPFNDVDDIMRELTNGSGLATEPYNYAGDVVVTVRVRRLGYEENISEQTIGSGGLALAVLLVVDTKAE